MAILLTLSLTPFAWGQHGSEGRVNVTVVDPQGAVIPGADLTLTDVATNDVRKAQTTQSGVYGFINLDIGTYRLSVGRTGFAQQTLDNITVQATKTTDITVTMTVGAQAQTVQVEGVAPVLETTTNQIGTVIDPKQIETLPISGRDLTQLSRLGAGYNGTWNGLPTYAQGNNVDGVVGSPSRMKFGGNSGSVISPRLENMEEMAISTDAMDMNQGFGQAAMQVGYVTKRGSNAWHGRAYEDFRSSYLNANRWSSDANGTRKAPSHLNDFGGSLGGPIWKDKLFFFGSLATQRIPGSTTTSNSVLTASAQAGNFTYVGTDNATHTVNLFNAAKAFNPSLPGSVNSAIGGQLSKINNTLSSGTVSGTSDPIVNTLTFLYPQPITFWYPTLRLDYNMSSRIRMNLSMNRTLRSSPGDSLSTFPSSDFASTQGGNRSDGATVGYGLDWTVTPHLINQLKVGWNYNASFFAYNSSKGYFQDPFEWNWPIVPSGKFYQRPINTYYPVTNIADTVAWQHGSHALSFGWSFVREHDHYWNGPEGIGGISFGLVNGDPALDALTNTGGYQPLPAANTTVQAEAQNLYALLTGRISGMSGLYPFSVKTQDYVHSVGSFNLNEVASAWGLFAQDSWRVKPNLTVNYGLRWDFTGDDYDKTSEYHNSDQSSVFGPTAPGDLFQPGKLNGNLSPTIQSRPHAYNSFNVSPQPSLGFSWAPQHEGGVLGAILGGKDSTVVRAGYNLRRFTIPYQYVWNYASTCGSFYYQNFVINPSNAPGAGNFAPGSLSLGQSLPAYAITPASFQKVAPESQFTFTAGAGNSCGINVTGFKNNIAQPYVESWNFGIQRRLGPSTVLEVRYDGNRGLKEWLTLNTNEVNIFENGFLKEFINAQNNLRINGGSSFGNINPAAGTVPLPILTAAFTGTNVTTGSSQTNSQFRNSTFITNLNTGAAGAFASRLATAAGAVPYFCNLVGAAFGPCASNLHYTGAGAGYPINFFQANPYADRNSGTNGGATALMTDSGYSSYNALQVDLRQQAWHGVQFDANYTWSKTLGTLAGGNGNDWLGNYTAFTLRNLRESYMPATFDVHHVVHMSTTAELPFGRGKKWLNSNGFADRVFGGWVVGSVMTVQSGYPFRLSGGFSTFNQFADDGLVLNGVTRQQLQDAIGVHKVPGASFSSPSRVFLINPQYLALSNPACATLWSAGCSVSGLNTNFINSNTTPGTIAPPLILYGPHGFYQDVMVTKYVPITERVKFNIQSVFLNAWNHPVFANFGVPISGNPRSSGIFTATGANSNPISNIGSRQIELRANIVF